LSPLATACRAANWTLAKFLLERGAKACPPGGEPALVAAAAIADDDPSGVRLLLKHRAAVNAVDARKRHALLGAAAEGHDQIARVLCEAGADVNLADQHGSDALMLACQSPHAEGATVSALLALGAEPKAPGSDGRSALDHATTAG